MAQFKFSQSVSMIDGGLCAPGDVKQIPDDVAARYEKHGWGEIVKPAAKKTATKKAGD